MTSKKVDVLEGEMEHLKADIEERYSGIAGRFSSMEERFGGVLERFGDVEDRFGRMEEMMRKMMEIQSKAPTVFPLGDPKGKGVRLEDEEVESVHPHDFPPRRQGEAGYGPYGGGPARRYGGREEGEPYGRSLGRGEPGTGSGEAWGEPWRTNDRREYGRDSNSRYHGGFGRGRGHGDPRVRKLKMPVFEGEDAHGWIYRVERYFSVNGLTEEERLTAAALCLEGKALSWYQWREQREPLRSWEEFKDCLLARFRTSRDGNYYE